MPPENDHQPLRCPSTILETPMHILFAIVMLLAAGALLVVGLLSVLRDLLDRHPSPLLEDDGLAWSSRYRGVAARSAGSELNRS